MCGGATCGRCGNEDVGKDCISCRQGFGAGLDECANEQQVSHRCIDQTNSVKPTTSTVTSTTKTTTPACNCADFSFGAECKEGEERIQDTDGKCWSSTYSMSGNDDFKCVCAVSITATSTTTTTTKTKTSTVTSTTGTTTTTTTATTAATTDTSTATTTTTTPTATTTVTTTTTTTTTITTAAAAATTTVLQNKAVGEQSLASATGKERANITNGNSTDQDESDDAFEYSGDTNKQKNHGGLIAAVIVVVLLLLVAAGVVLRRRQNEQAGTLKRNVMGVTNPTYSQSPATSTHQQPPEGNLYLVPTLRNDQSKEGVAYLEPVTYDSSGAATYGDIEGVYSGSTPNYAEVSSPMHNTKTVPAVYDEIDNGEESHFVEANESLRVPRASYLEPTPLASRSGVVSYMEPTPMEAMHDTAAEAGTGNGPLYATAVSTTQQAAPPMAHYEYAEAGLALFGTKHAAAGHAGAASKKAALADGDADDGHLTVAGKDSSERHVQLIEYDHAVGGDAEFC